MASSNSAQTASGPNLGGLNNLDKATLLGVAVLAVTVQIQSSVEIGTATVRASVSDLAALALGPLAVMLLHTRLQEIGAAIGLRLSLLFGLTIVVMAYGLATGAMRIGALEPWPIVKFVGWLSLLYYGFLSLLFAYRLPRLAPRVFAAFYIATMGILLLVHNVFFVLSVDWIGSYAYRYQGVLDNPNAQGFAMLCGVAICLAGQQAIGRRIGRIGAEVLAGFVLAGLVHTSSLSALAAAVLMVLAHIVFGTSRFSSTLRILVFAAAIFGCAQAGRSLAADIQVRTAINDFTDKAVWLIRPDAKRPGVSDASIKVRFESYQQAFVDWTKAPVFGTGLGTHMAAQGRSVDPQRPAQQIHNTGLWILSEMGGLGLAVFLTLYGVLFMRYRAVYLNRHSTRSDIAEIAYVAMLVMFGWFVMSQAHEMLYQRTLWLILGLALGASVRVAANRHGFAKKCAPD